MSKPPKSHSTESPESQEEQNKRVDAMLRCMVVEAGLHSMENGESPPKFSRDQIADFCGCSKDTIRRIEEKALEKLKGLLS